MSPPSTFTSNGGSPVEQIIETLADLENCDPIDLHPPLNDAVDVDALESLLQHWQVNGGDGSIQFRYNNYTVTVHSWTSDSPP
jgi:hypothetical protein